MNETLPRVDHSPFLVESELPPERNLYTDGVDTWEEDGYYYCNAPAASCHNQTIEQQFAQRGLYNVPQSVIDRIKKKAEEDYGSNQA